MKRLLLGLLLLPTVSIAQPGQAAKKPDKKLLSISYRAVLDCYPNLEDTRLESTVDLRILKDKIDEKYVSEKQKVLHRFVQFQEPGTGQIRRVRLDSAETSSTSTAQWESVSPSGIVEGWHEPHLKTSGLTNEDITAAIGHGVIGKDETETLFTKLDGIRMLLKRDLANISALKLEDIGGAHVLSCRSTSEVGVVCTCAKKNAGT